MLSFIKTLVVAEIIAQTVLLLQALINLFTYRMPGLVIFNVTMVLVVGPVADAPAVSNCSSIKSLMCKNSQFGLQHALCHCWISTAEDLPESSCLYRVVVL